MLTVILCLVDRTTSENGGAASTRPLPRPTGEVRLSEADARLEEIVYMWRFSRNNGITEGFHRKLKLIQRRAYGFRSFLNCRLRVLA